MATLKVTGESISSSSLAEINVITGGNDQVSIMALKDTPNAPASDGDILQYSTIDARWNYATLPNKINTALQPGDNVSELVNDAGYITSVPAETFSLADIKAAVAASPTYADFVTYINNL